MKADGHIHSPYCPHGSNDPFVSYIEWGIDHGLEEMTFTEHAPLPRHFTDPTPLQDSAMKPEDLQPYIKELQALKKEYRSAINIHIGLEFDFIEGYENETKEWMDEIGPYLDDSILSVHFLKNSDRYYCMDYSEEYFRTMIGEFGSVDNIYNCYYQTVSKSLLADLGAYKPARVGHITLSHKFQLVYPPRQSFRQQELELIRLAKKMNFSLDYNGAGSMKPFCQETYPPQPLAEEALRLGVPLIYGSDAHRAADLGQGYSELAERSQLSKPTDLWIKE